MKTRLLDNIRPLDDQPDAIEADDDIFWLQIEYFDCPRCGRLMGFHPRNDMGDEPFSMAYCLKRALATTKHNPTGLGVVILDAALEYRPAEIDDLDVEIFFGRMSLIDPGWLTRNFEVNKPTKAPNDDPQLSLSIEQAAQPTGPVEQAADSPENQGR